MAIIGLLVSVEEVESINKWEAWQGGGGAGTLIILTYSYYQDQDSDQS